MNAPAVPARVEPRWPVAIATLAVIFVLAALPGRMRLMPVWCLYVAGVAMVVPMAGASLGTAKTGWLVVERTVTLLVVVVMIASTLAALVYLVVAMVRRSSELGGLELLTSSVAAWVSNVLMFALLYWQIDRGGPGARANGMGRRPDLYFSQEGAPPQELPPDWRPTFVDYLYHAFSTATAFSATDTVPMTARAKMAMMLESSISLVTIVVVGARAINVIGS
jgi:uncharacterized membrane protein